MATNGWQKALLERDAEWDRKLTASHTALSKDIKDVATSMGREIGDLANELRKNHQKEEPKSYSIYQLGFAVLVVLAGLVWWPIQITFSSLDKSNITQDSVNAAQDTRIENLVNLIGTEVKARSDMLAKEAEARNAAFTALAERAAADFITRREFESIAARGKEERERTTKQFEMLQSNVFSKDVHLERWNGFREQLAALAARVDAGDANLQREIDVIQKSLGDQWTLRDAFVQSQERLDKLDDLIRDLTGKRIPPL